MDKQYYRHYRAIQELFCRVTSQQRTWNIQDSCHLCNILWHSVTLEFLNCSTKLTWQHVPAYQLYEWNVHSVEVELADVKTKIFISQIVASNRPGGQRSGPGGWLLLSWWVWRILPSSLQVSISPSLSPWGQQSYSIEGQRSQRGVVCGLWCGVVWCGVVWCGVVWCGLCWLRYLTLNKWIISTGILHWNEVACPGLVSALFLAVFPLILWSTSGGYVPGLTSTSFHSQNYNNSISICGEEYTGVQSTGQSSHIFKNPNQIKFPALLPINVVAAAALGRLQGWLSMSNVAWDSPREAQARVEWLPSLPFPSLPFLSFPFLSYPSYQ